MTLGSVTSLYMCSPATISKGFLKEGPTPPSLTCVSTEARLAKQKKTRVVVVVNCVCVCLIRSVAVLLQNERFQLEVDRCLKCIKTVLISVAV